MRGKKFFLISFKIKIKVAEKFKKVFQIAGYSEVSCTRNDERRQKRRAVVMNPDSVRCCTVTEEKSAIAA